jgi:ribosome-binding factor A
MKQIALIIERDIKHPSIDGIISVTGVDVTRDLSLARIRISIINTDNPKEEIIDALNHSAGFIRKQLKTKINIRTIPQLIFNFDTNIEYAVKISKLIDEVNKD